ALVTRNADGRVIDLGFIPQEPGWYVYELPYWFGGELYDRRTRKLTLNSPECIRAFNWIEGFSKRLGPDAITDFRDSSGTFNSPQNAFLTGHAAMVLQGPWMAFYTESLRPKMNRWKHPK